MVWADKKTAIQILQYAITLALVIAICLYVNVDDLADALTNINLVFLLFAVICYLLNNLAMSYRLKRLLGYAGHKVRFKLAFFSHMSGMLASDFTPARSGYLFTAYALDKYGVPADKSLASITSTYLYDFTFKVLIGLLGLYYFYSTIYSPGLGLPLLLTIFFIFCLIMGYAIIMYPPPLLRKLGDRKGTIKKILDFGEQSRSIQRHSPLIVSVTVLGWILRGLQWFFIALSIGGGFLTIADSLFLNPLLSLLSFVPLTPGGLGIQEAGIAGFLAFIGVPGTVAITFAFVVRLVEIGVDAIGIKCILAPRVDVGNLLRFYNAIDGDADERAYNSDLLVQRYWQRRKTSAAVEALQAKAGDVIVDIGCGSGVQIGELCRSGPALAIGIDMNANALKYARRKRLPNTEYVLAEAGHLPIRPACVDGVVCCEVIEHLIDPEMMVGEAKRILKDSGTIVITTPNERSAWGAYEVLWDAFGRGRDYGHTHLKFYTWRDLAALFRAFPECLAKTIFFVSPVFALSNDEKLLDIGVRIDRAFEKYHLGALIVFTAKRSGK